MLQYDPFIRIPFTIEAVEVTEENMSEIAQLIGEVKKRGGVKFIETNRRLVPFVVRVDVGWFVTRFNGAYRAYAPDVFVEQFMPYQIPVTFNLPLPEVDEPIEA